MLSLYSNNILVVIVCGEQHPRKFTVYLQVHLSYHEADVYKPQLIAAHYTEATSLLHMGVTVPFQNPQRM